VADYAVNRFAASSGGSQYKQSYYAPYSAPQTDFLPLRDETQVLQFPSSHTPHTPHADAGSKDAASSAACENAVDYPLGFAKCQLHGTYIIAENKNGFVVVDQHAAHERLTYERYKQQVETKGISRQPLLVPEVIELREKQLESVLAYIPKFAEYGFAIEKFGTNAIAVTEVPNILLNYGIKQLITDIADDIIEQGDGRSLMDAFEHVLETAACHNSIRAGRKLSTEEMNQLLRQMEATPFSGQCNHGRPTYVELKLPDIEKLFGRS
jgi:DNA mismatch repair protein MutL